MKSTTLAMVSVLVSVMASGCAATTDEGFEEEALDDESIGSVQQAVGTALAWGNLVCGSQSEIEEQIGTEEDWVGKKLSDICWYNGDANLVVMKSLLPLWRYYDPTTGLELPPDETNRPLWHAPIVINSESTYEMDSDESCYPPYAHLMFKSTGWNTWTNCKKPTWGKYAELTTTQRTNECANIMATTAAKNQSAANGTPFTTNCQNIVTFDPMVTNGGCGFFC